MKEEHVHRSRAPELMRRTHSVVTPGNHDGVHLGHRALIDAAKQTADAHGWQTLAMCFEPHPTAVLVPERAPVLITDMKRRVEILKGAGCDDVVVLPFDSEFSKMTPDQFVERVLLEACHAKGVVVGPISTSDTSARATSPRCGSGASGTASRSSWSSRSCTRGRRSPRRGFAESSAKTATWRTQPS